MRTIFNYIGRTKSNGDYTKYVMPWALLHRTHEQELEEDRTDILYRIRDWLWDLRIDMAKELDLETASTASDEGFLAIRSTQARSQRPRRNYPMITRFPVAELGNSQSLTLVRRSRRESGPITPEPHFIEGPPAAEEEEVGEQEEERSDSESSYLSRLSEVSDAEPQEAQDMMLAAENYLGNGRPSGPSRALSVLESLESKYCVNWHREPPDELYILMGEACMKTARKERDNEKLERISSALLLRDPTNPDALYWRGRFLAEKLDVPNATVCFTAALAYDPQFPQASKCLNLARKYQELSNSRHPKSKDSSSTTARFLIGAFEFAGRFSVLQKLNKLP
jgi:hypothetical protein